MGLVGGREHSGSALGEATLGVVGDQLVDPDAQSVQQAVWHEVGEHNVAIVLELVPLVGVEDALHSPGHSWPRR